MTDPNELLSAKELAASLGRNPSFVYRMRSKGFVMIGDRGTLRSALEWIKLNGSPWKDERKR